jgi:hypothetical protein
MNLNELEELALAAIRFRAQEWTDTSKYSAEEWYRYTSAVQYDFVRLKCQVARVRNGTADDEVLSSAGALENLRVQFDYTPDKEMPSPENYWPAGLQYRLRDHMRAVREQKNK